MHILSLDYAWLITLYYHRITKYGPSFQISCIFWDQLSGKRELLTAIYLDIVSFKIKTKGDALASDSQKALGSIANCHTLPNMFYYE